MPAALKARLEKLEAAQKTAARPMSDAERAVKLAYLLDKIKREKNDATADRLAASPAERIDVGSIPSSRTVDSTH